MSHAKRGALGTVMLAFFETAPEWVWVMDDTGTVIFLNQQARWVLGWNPAASRTGQFPFADADFRIAYKEITRDTERTQFSYYWKERKQALRVEISLMGSILEEQFLITRVFDSTEEWTRYRDLSLRQEKMAEEPSEEEVACRFLPDTTLIHATPSYLALFGKNPPRFGEKWVEKRPIAEQEDILRRYKELREYPKILWWEQQFCSEDGSSIRYDFVDTPTFNSEGKVKEIRSVGVKQEERVPLRDFHQYPEVALKERLSLLQTLLDELEGLIFISATKTGRILFANRLARERIPNLQTSLCREVVDAFSTGCRRCDVNRGSDEECCEGFWDENAERFYNYRRKILPLLGMKGVCLHVLMDVTAQKRIEEDLVEARDRALDALSVKSGFVKRMSHELRTPIHAISSYSDLAVYDLEIDQLEDLPYYLTSIHKSAEHLLALVTDLLDFSAIENRKIRYYFQENSLAYLVSLIASEYAPYAKEKGIVLEYANPTFSTTAMFDDSRIAQVIRNILGNAIKFTPKDNVVEVCIREVGEDYLQLTVRDAGIGIPEEELFAIFDEFVQGTKEKHTSGTGLGLAICKRIVDDHQGLIWAVNNEQRGVSFHVRLPRYPLEGSVSGELSSTGR